MIQIIPHMKILLAIEPADFRKGIDGLADICRRVLQADPNTKILAAHELQLLLWNGDPTISTAGEMWKILEHN